MHAMGIPSRQPGFQELLAQWNERLEESGFCDIEIDRGHQRFFRNESFRGPEGRYSRMDDLAREAKDQFYRYLAQKIEEERDRIHESRRTQDRQRMKERHLQILVLYAEGHKQRDIQKILGLEGSINRVRKPLFRWLKRWGLA